MHWLQGMSHRALAKQVAIGDKGVEYHMMRALARFHKVVANLQ